VISLLILWLFFLRAGNAFTYACVSPRTIWCLDCAVFKYGVVKESVKALLEAQSVTVPRPIAQSSHWLLLYFQFVDVLNSNERNTRQSINHSNLTHNRNESTIIQLRLQPSRIQSSIIKGRQRSGDSQQHGQWAFGHSR
jgi:hypothetical protein